MRKKWKQKAIACLTALAMVGTLLPQNPFGISRTVEAADSSIPTPKFLYTFEENDVAKKGGVTTVDSIGVYSNGATIVGAGTIKNDDGGYFDNNSESSTISTRQDYLSLPSAVASMLYEKKGVSTISMWIKAPEGAAIDKNYGFYSPLFAAKHNVAFKQEDNTSDAWWPLYNVGLRGTQQVNCDGYFDNTENADVAYLDDHQWHLVTAVCGNGTSTVYIDGKVVNTKETGEIFTGTFAENFDVVSVGGNNIWTWNDPDTHLYFDDVAVYDEVLTADQITTLYTEGRKTNQSETMQEMPKVSKEYDFEDSTEIDLTKGALIEEQDSNKVLHIQRNGTGADGKQAVISSPFINNTSLDGFTISLDVYNLECDSHDANSLDGILGFNGNSQEFALVSTPGVYKFDGSGFYDYNQHSNITLQYEKGTWYTLTLVVGPQGIELYKNGTRINVTTTGGKFSWNDFKNTVTAEDSKVIFGYSKYWGTENAYLDNIRFYESALTPKEVRIITSNNIEFLEFNLTKAAENIEEKDGIYTIPTDLATKNEDKYDIDLSDIFSGATLKCYYGDEIMTASIAFDQLIITGDLTSIPINKEIPITFQYGNASIIKKIIIKIDTYPIVIDASNASLTDVNGDSIDPAVEIIHGEEFSFKVTPDAGYAIDSVSYTLGEENPVIITAEDGCYKVPSVTDNLKITVTTKLKNYPITYYIDGEELVEIGELLSEYTVNTTELTLSPLTKEGYDFDGWYTSKEYTGTTVSSYTIDSNKDLVDTGLSFYAKWKAKSYKVSISEVTNGTVTVSSTGVTIENNASIPFNETVEVVVMPEQEKEIESFSVKTSTDNVVETSSALNQDGSITYTFKMPAEDIVITAVFTEISEHSISIADTEKAVITVNKETGYAGDNIIVTVEPKEEFIGDYNLGITVKSQDTTIPTTIKTENVADGKLEYTFTLQSQDVVVNEAFSYLAVDATERSNAPENAVEIDFENRLLVKKQDSLEITESLLDLKWVDFLEDISLDDLGTVVYVRTKGSLIGGIYTPASQYETIKIQYTPIVIANATAVYGKMLSEIIISGSAVYNGKEVEGTFQWEEDNASAIKPNAGIIRSYTAVFIPDNKDIYKEVTGIKVELTIEKANPEYELPSGLTAVEGSTLGTVELPKGFSFTDSVDTSVGAVGENKFEVIYTPEDTENYNIVKDIVIITVTEKSSEGDTPSIPTTPGGIEGPSTPTTPGGIEGPSTPTTPGGIEGPSTPTTPGGIEGPSTPTTPGGIEGPSTPTTPGGIEGPSTPTTPGGIEGPSTPTTPGGIEGPSTPTTPGGIEGDTPSTPTPPPGGNTSTTPGSSNSSGSSSSGSSNTSGNNNSNTNTDNNQGTVNTPSITTKPDGTVVETKKETMEDGTIKETVKETAIDGAVKETITETSTNGSVKETVKETTADNSVTKETVTETSANGSVTIEATATDQKNATVLTAIVEKDADGKVTKADAVISAGAAATQVNGKKAMVTVNVSDVIMNTAAENKDINSIIIEITKPVLSSAYENKNVTNGVTVNVNVNTVDNVEVSGIVLTSDSIAEAKAAGQKLTINVIMKNKDKKDYKVVIPAKQLKKITDITKPVNIMIETIAAEKLSEDSSKSQVASDMETVLTKSKAKKAKTYILSVAENENFAAGMKITADVDSNTTISANQTVYVYKYNKKTGKFVEVANSKQTVSSDGKITIDAKSGVDYVVSSKKLSGNKVTTIKSQITATGKSSVKAGKNLNINVTLPSTLKKVKSFGDSNTFGKEQAIVLYESSNKKIATVTINGTIKAKKAGNVTITITIGMKGGQTKKIKKNITVK